MNLQIIKSTTGQPEYVLLPIKLYQQLKHKIDSASLAEDQNYEPFVIEDYIDNPVAVARIKSKLTQQELADAMGVTQAYISKLEKQLSVSPKTLQKVKSSLKQLKK